MQSRGRGGGAYEQFRKRDRRHLVLHGLRRMGWGFMNREAHTQRLHRGQGWGWAQKESGAGWGHSRMGTQAK